jgi:hypothetical protein
MRLTGQRMRSDMATRGRPAKYPWEEWFDGNFRVLKRGRDFDPENTGIPTAKSMRALVKHSASVYGGQAETKVPDANSVYFTFVNS